MKMQNSSLLCANVVIAFLCLPVWANITVPSIFSDNVVLQRNVEVPVWGWADPGERVTVSLEKQQQTAIAGKDGAWSVKLKKHAEGGPYVITLTGHNTITLTNVLFGEVWFCSGQSNMQMLVAPSRRSWIAGGVENYAGEVAEADYPQIRMLTVPFDEKTLSFTPKRDCGGAWIVCSPQSVGEFAAIPYFFGRKLFRDMKVPIGLINDSLGGSQVEPWISTETFRREDCLQPFTAAWEKTWADYQASLATATPKPNPVDHHITPSALYNGMVAPLVPYGIRGFIWYQGESNAAIAATYAPRFQALIRDWRRHWARNDLPFLFVQLAPIGGESYSRLREAQRQALVLPNTAMIATVDSDFGLHPRKKLPVGERLALAAEALAYRQHVEYSGPLYAGMTVEGDAMRLRFTHVGSGLTTGDGRPLKGFAVAGADGKFVPADAVIAQDAILVSSKTVPHPVKVRYAWVDDPGCNLINKNGLPAPSFEAGK